MCKLHDVDPNATQAAQQTALSTGGLVGDVAPVMKDTKFGKLLKIAAPIVMGGAIGATANSRQSGAGQEAANQFFMQQRQMAIQKALMQRQLQNDWYKNMLDAARTQHEVSMPPLGAGASRTWTTTDPQHVTTGSPNEPHTFSMDPYDPTKIIDRGIATPKAQPKTTIERTDQGFVPITVSPQGQTTVGSPLTTTAPKSILAGDEGSTGPVAAGGQVPLEPYSAPKKSETKPAVRSATRTDSTGASETDLIDENPDSPTFGKVLKKNVGSRAPRTASNDDVERSAESIVTQAKQEKVDPEVVLGRVLNKIPPQYRAAVRARIREIGKPLKPTPKKGSSSFDQILQQSLNAAGGAPGGDMMRGCLPKSLPRLRITLAQCWLQSSLGLLTSYANPWGERMIGCLSIGS